MSLLDTLKQTWVAQVDTILHRHIPERLKAIESSLSPEHNAKKRRLDLGVVESKAIEEASYLIQYTGRVVGWARRELLQLDMQNDNDETVICCKVVQTGASKGEKESREILRMYVVHHTERAKTLSEKSSDKDKWEKALGAEDDAYAIELHHALQRIQNAYMTFWDAAVRLYKLRHGRSRVAYE